MMIEIDTAGRSSAADLTDANRDGNVRPNALRMRRISALRRVLGMLAVAMLPLFALSQKAAAQSDDYPSKPIRLVIPYGTGGVSDSVGRIVATAMTKVLGQTVYSENRGGGGGTIGAAVVAKSPADGYTILLTSPPMVAVAPALLPSLSYDAEADFTPIGTFVVTPNILVVNPSLPFKTMAEFAAYAKGEGKDKLSYASAGPGSTGHLSGHILKTSMGIDMQHIPYKSSGLAFPDVISGRVSMVFDSLPSTISHVRAGKVRPIAVMSEKRSPLLPEVPTAAEAGYPAATMTFWMALEGPPKMPAPIVEKLYSALKTAVATQAMRDQLSTLGAEPFMSSPQQFKTLRHNDIMKLRQLVKDMGLRPE
jgi:tripartite-type tricarboxylate transporter receptor subunit TctC